MLNVFWPNRSPRKPIRTEPDDIDARYSTAIALHNEIHGVVAMDMTMPQLARFRAVEAARWDVVTAKRVTFQRIRWAERRVARMLVAYAGPSPTPDHADGGGM